MATYSAPVNDTLFLLNSVFRIDRYNNLPGFEDATPDLVQAILGEAGRVCEEVLQPLNRTGDVEGCTRNEDASVTTPAGFGDAYSTFIEGGWNGLSADPEIRRAGIACDPGCRGERIYERGQYGLRHVSRAHQRCDRGPHPAWICGAEGTLSSEDGRR